MLLLKCSDGEISVDEALLSAHSKVFKDMSALPLADSEERECQVTESVEQMELFCRALRGEDLKWGNEGQDLVDLALMADKYDSLLARNTIADVGWSLLPPLHDVWTLDVFTVAAILNHQRLANAAAIASLDLDLAESAEELMDCPPQWIKRLEAFHEVRRKAAMAALLKPVPQELSVAIENSSLRCPSPRTIHADKALWDDMVLKELRALSPSTNPEHAVTRNLFDMLKVTRGCSVCHDRLLEWLDIVKHEYWQSEKQWSIGLYDGVGV